MATFKVTVFAGDGKFTVFEHKNLYRYTVHEGALTLLDSLEQKLFSYAPGAWLKVEKE